MTTSIYKDLQSIDIPEIFMVTKAWLESTHPDKVNLGIGVYRDNDGQPWSPPVIQEAERQVIQDQTRNCNYLPLSGSREFRTAALRLLLGENHRVIREKRVEVYQTIGGVGAIHLASCTLKKSLGLDIAYTASHTWNNGTLVMEASGISQIKRYRYWHDETKGLDFEGMVEDLQAASHGAMVVLQAVGHNPTGVDPTREQWVEIARVCKERQLVVVLDCAYHGIASGDLEEDGWVMRYFADQDIDMFIAQSFSKNMGLYGERVGALAVITKDLQINEAMQSQIELNIQKIWSTCAKHGASIATLILNDEVLFAKWKTQIASMTTRIKKMRHDLHENLKRLGTPGNWDHIEKHIGMYCFSGLTGRQVEYMRSKHVFMPSSGRICVPGLQSKNVEYVAKCIDEAVRKFPKNGIDSS